jgi:low temperature requirement protein LtrA
VPPRASLRRDAGAEQRATTLELFYDLVFVFAVTQVSHLLIEQWASDVSAVDRGSRAGRATSPVEAPRAPSAAAAGS